MNTVVMAVATAVIMAARRLGMKLRIRVMRM
jgi:hypothetical protein